MATSHLIVFTSALCKDTYPDNHGGDFVNTLNTPLELNEPGQQWVVSLSEISYQPDSWYNVRNGFNEISFSMHSFPSTTVGRKCVFSSRLNRPDKDGFFQYERVLENGKKYTSMLQRKDGRNYLIEPNNPIFLTDKYWGYNSANLHWIGNVENFPTTTKYGWT